MYAGVLNILELKLSPPSIYAYVPHRILYSYFPSKNKHNCGDEHNGIIPYDTSTIGIEEVEKKA